jgi:hypothetical protein
MNQSNSLFSDGVSGVVRRKLSEAKLYPKPMARINVNPTHVSKQGISDVALGQRAQELFLNASSFLTGVLSGPRSKP